MTLPPGELPFRGQGPSLKETDDAEEQVQRGADHRGAEGGQAGLPVAEVCRKHGISDATFYTWRSKYGGLEVSDAKRLKALEEEE